MAENILKHPQFDEVASALEADRGLPKGSLRAVAMQESGGNPDAVSPKGARGAFQFIPATAKAYNVDVTNPWDSLRGAADYLGDNVKKYGRFDAALADYNGGPSQAKAVLQNGTPTFKETQNYVTKIVGKIGDAVIPSAHAEEVPQRPQAAPQPQQASPLSQELKTAAGFKVTKAKQQGISDDGIIQGFIESAPKEVAALIQHNLKMGVSPTDLVVAMGGQPYAEWQKDIKNANPTNGMSAFDRGLAAMGKSFSDVGTGAKQLATRVFGTDEDVRAQQAAVAEEERLAAPLMDTTAGKVGYAAGVVAPTVATLGAGAAVNGLARIPQAARAMQAVNAAGRLPGVAQAVNAAGGVMAPTTVPGMAASGAVQGAMMPTTNDSDAINNTVFGGAGSGLAGGALKRLAAPMGTQAADAAPALIQKAEQYGLPVSAANVIQDGGSSPAQWMVRKLSNPSNAQVANVDQAIVRNVGEGVGVPNAATIDHTLTTAATPYAQFDALTAGTQIPVSGGRMRADLASALDKYGRSTLSQNGAVVDEVNGLIRKTAPVNGANPAFSPQELQGWKAELGQRIDNASTADTQLLVAARNAIDSQVTPRLSAEQLSAFNKGNEQWKNLKAVEEMVKKSGDSGAVTPAQMVQSIKNASVGNNFTTGNAAYQDLATTLNKLYGKGGLQSRPAVHSPSLAEMAMGGFGFAAGGLPGAALPLASRAGGAVLRKALDSQTPAVRNAVLGNTQLQKQLINLKGPALAAALARLQVTTEQK